MPLTGNADLDTIFLAFQSWEQTELAVHDSTFKAFAHFPAQTDVNLGLTCPYSIHQMVNGSAAPLSLDQGTEYRRHSFYTYLALAPDHNDMASAQSKAALWLGYYRDGYIKHRHLRNLLAAPNDGVLITDPPREQAQTAFSYEFGDFQLFGKNVVGLRFPFVVYTRHTVTSAE